MESYKFDKFYQKTWFVLLASFTALLIAVLIIFFAYKSMIKATTADPNPLAEDTHKSHEEFLKEQEDYKKRVEEIEKEYEEVLEDWENVKEYINQD